MSSNLFLCAVTYSILHNFIFVRTDEYCSKLNQKQFFEIQLNGKYHALRPTDPSFKPIKLYFFKTELEKKKTFFIKFTAFLNAKSYC